MKSRANTNVQDININNWLVYSETSEHGGDGGVVPLLASRSKGRKCHVDFAYP